MRVSGRSNVTIGLFLVCFTLIRSAELHAFPAQCRVGILEGEISAGQSFTRPIGNGLEAMLEALPSGWIIRVLPVNHPRPSHDYAELATPPYRSVSPLLLSTDYSFRAQDAAGWTPRRFRFETNQKSFAQLLGAYNEYKRTDSSSSQEALARLVSQLPEGTLAILDIHFVPGTGDQVPAAAAVAQHLASTAHTLERPPDGRSSILGRLTWMRFRMSLQLPREFPMDSRLKSQSCEER